MFESNSEKLTKVEVEDYTASAVSVLSEAEKPDCVQKVLDQRHKANI